ncbi:MAG: TlpA family protein disulfide reductase [Thermoplasmata archaeon]
MRLEGVAKLASIFLFLSLLVFETVPTPQALKKAPDFTLTDIGGNEFSLSDFEGKAVILDFMATLCSPCLAEMGHLVELRGKYSEEQLQIISMDIDRYETCGDLRSLAENCGADWIFAIDASGVAELYDIGAIPTLVVVDPEGYTQYQGTGLRSIEFLERQVKLALGIIQPIGLLEVMLILLLALIISIVLVIYFFRIRRKGGRDSSHGEVGSP